MASVDKTVFLSAVALTADRTSDAKALSPRNKSFVGFIKAASVHADTTVAAKIQHSPNGSDWYDLVSFTNIVGTAGSELKQITDSVLPQVKAVVTLTGTTKQATVTLELYHE